MADAFRNLEGVKGLFEFHIGVGHIATTRSNHGVGYEKLFGRISSASITLPNAKQRDSLEMFVATISCSLST